jgi:PAS domain S-box-containing protein
MSQAVDHKTFPQPPVPDDAQAQQRPAALLAAIVESSVDAIVSKDLNGIVTSWNQGAERIFGWTAAEMVGRPITTIIPPELREEETRILAKIQAGERIEHFETVRLRKDGTRLDVSLTISPVHGPEGIVGAAKIARDITEQKRLRAALHTTERLASVGRLAATVAHEINNPLEAVTNLIYLARQQPGLSERTLRYLNSADEELARVAHIAQQTLGFYRDSSEPVLIEVAAVIDDVLEIYERKFRYKGLEVERRIGDGLVVCVLQGELKQVLSNLIANAIDASPEGGRILVSARPWRNGESDVTGVRISVADVGAGIPMEHRQEIFAPFFTSKKDMGTGLGLWITKELLEKRGGRLRFRSRVGPRSGTVMTVFLPPTPAVALKKAV